jgi:ribosomal protein S18 acetylase RimI-like enzyme
LHEVCFTELRAIYYPTKAAEELKGSSTTDWVSFGYFISEKLVAGIEVNPKEGELSLRSLVVSNDYRRQGVARKLVYGVINSFADIKIVSLWCVKQTGNVQMFESLGFKVIQEFQSELLEAVDGGKVIEVQLQLSLNTSQEL